MSNDAITRGQEMHPDVYTDMLYVVGDATDEKSLLSAGLDAAAGVITVLPSDKDNLVITVVVHQRNPGIRIVSRCTHLSYAERMRKVCASATVSPNHIGGLRMASEMIRPSVVSFLDLMLQDKSRTLRIEEIAVSEKSAWVGKSISEIGLGQRFSLLPLAVKVNSETGSQAIFNPPPTTRVSADSIVIVMGEAANVSSARAEGNP
jgi:voltage-gated potassium channel